MREVVGSNPTATTMLSLSIPHDSRFAAVETPEELLKEIQHVEQKIGQESGVIREPGKAGHESLRGLQLSRRRSGRAEY